jgi:hypothetical protein
VRRVEVPGFRLCHGGETGHASQPNKSQQLEQESDVSLFSHGGISSSLSFSAVSD